MSYNQKQQQIHRLLMSPKMQQAIKLLEVPVLELTTMIESELEQNPVLEISEFSPEEENTETPQDEDLPVEKELNFDEKNFDILKQLDEESQHHYLEGAGFATRRSAEEEKKEAFKESSIVATESLFRCLMNQARETFATSEDLAMAEQIIGNINSSGFLKVPLQEIAQTQGFNEIELKKILERIQTFDPIGVGATTLQEALLIQLRLHSKDECLASKIITHHFEDLIHNRIPNIAKGLKCSVEEIKAAIDEDISKLDLHPGANRRELPIQTITPDITIQWENNEWNIFTNTEAIPLLKLNRKYLRMLEDEHISKEAKDFIKSKILSAKWLIQSIDQRSTTLERLARALAFKQERFFLHPEGKLAPLAMKALAEELGLNESTITRAIANKYIHTPRGIFPLRFFFSNAYTTHEGEELSSKTVRDILKRLIDEEDKKAPLSDEALSLRIKEQGICCARRTIAKYRVELQLGSARQRKTF